MNRSVAVFLVVVSTHANIGMATEELTETSITANDRDHWSFRPIENSPAPAVQNRSWCVNPIDAFVLSRLENIDLRPASEATKLTLVRRLYFDLLGLPPSPEQIREFVNDKSLDGYERLVDRLLASPHYGQRWAQYWLDLARFAETDGFEHDKVRPNSWRYRDWVIESLNRDMGYDRFVQLQIAGDAFEPNETSAQIATAFCLSGPDMPDINSQVERKHTLLNEMTSTLGSALLGLQFGCAQCHDHKFDPISQADFYRLRAFFVSAVRVKRDQPVSTLICDGKVEPSHILIRGDWRRLGPEVEPAFPRIANSIGVNVETSDADTRRMQLAQWMTQPQNPLTARVIVNRVWQFHFGRGLCETSSDFGTMGDSPSHPELLDWLATQLMQHDWSLKELHRMMLSSATYRQRSKASSPPDVWERKLKLDPTNRLLSRFPRRRLDAEEIRDAMFAASDALVLSFGGPGVRPPLPRELLDTLLKNQWIVSDREADHFRRSVYLFARRNLRYPMFAAFDRPAANSSCSRRQVSTTAQQSLFMLNSNVSLQAAERLAEAVRFNAGDTMRDQVNDVFLRCYGRPVSDRELRSITKMRAANDNEFLIDVCLAVLNSNEFLFVD